MNILIASDSHDNWEKLSAAVRLGNERECEILLFAGDLISPPGIEVLGAFTGEVHLVLGNNEGELIALTRAADKTSNITLHGNLNGGTMEAEFDGLRFYMNHYPLNAEHAAASGKYDVVIYGHTHEYHNERVANGTLLINPGEVQGYRTGTASVALLNTLDRTVERINL